jgi:hypothetical protein
MADVSLRAYLAALDRHELAAVLRRRPDVLVEPAPASLHELAYRLAGRDSLAHALPLMDADEVAATRVIAVAGPASIDVIAERLRADTAIVGDTVTRLRERALAYEVDGAVALPELLAQHFAAELQHLRPLAAIVKQALVTDLRTAVEGLGGDSRGLTKARLSEQLTTLLGDPQVVARAVAALPPAARRHLDLIRTGELYFSSGREGPVAHLTQAGLLIGGPYHRPELPREVAATLALDASPSITGRPALPPSSDNPTDGSAAAGAAVRALVSLLDEATAHPLARLTKGGVGSRERARLAKRLRIDEPALWIDLAAALGMIDAADGAYTAAERYPTWREEPVARRWADIALGWLALDLAPTSREIDDDGGEVAPPEPMVSGAGLLRRAWLRATAGGRSLAAAAAHLEWFAPLHGYDDAGRERKIAAARHEAELLGIVAGDRLTALGELLVEEREPAPLAARATELLPDTPGLLVVQSDLTALASGQPTAATAALLAACAVPENRDAAAVWRFTPASVRSALDTGWTVDELRSGLVEASGRPLPQPVLYLFADVARRHGSIRARAACTCLTGAEAEITEIAHTRGLAKLRLSLIAPTVLISPLAVDTVLTGLRAAGFSPMPAGPDDALMVPSHPTPRRRQRRQVRERLHIDADVLAARLIGTTDATPTESPIYAHVAHLAPQLDPGEVALLADAIENERDIHIRYRNKDGNHSVRDIAPVQLVDRWVHAWCYLRSGEREFALRGIESVGPTAGQP